MAGLSIIRLTEKIIRVSEPHTSSACDFILQPGDSKRGSKVLMRLQAVDENGDFIDEAVIEKFEFTDHYAITDADGNQITPAHTTLSIDDGPVRAFGPLTAAQMIGLVFGATLPNIPATEAMGLANHNVRDAAILIFNNLVAAVEGGA